MSVHLRFKHTQIIHDPGTKLLVVQFPLSTLLEVRELILVRQEANFFPSSIWCCLWLTPLLAPIERTPEFSRG